MKKKITFLLMALILAAIGGYSQNTTIMNESFENINEFPPDGWSIVNFKPYTGSSKTRPAIEISQHSYLGVYSASWHVYNDQGGWFSEPYNSALVTPPIYAKTGEKLSFYVKVDTTASFQKIQFTVEVASSPDENAVRTVLQTVDLNDCKEYNHYEVSLDDYDGDTVYVFFHSNKMSMSIDADLYLDDVSGVTIPAVMCRSVKNFVATDFYVDSVKLAWSDYLYNVGKYDIEYMPAASSDWTNAQTVIATDTIYTLTSLNSSTEYVARVRPNCGDSDDMKGKWTDEIRFMTMHAPMSINEFPDTSDFTYDNGMWFIPIQQPVLYETPVPIPDSVGPTRTAKGEILCNGLGDMFLVSPQIVDAGIDQFSVNFNVRCLFNTGNTPDSILPAYIQVGVMTDPNDTSTFIPIDEISHNTLFTHQYQSRKINYDLELHGCPNTSAGNYLAFRIHTYFKYFKTSMLAYCYPLWIDDIIVYKTPDCLNPTKNTMQMTAVSDTNASFSWADRHEENTAWNVYYKDIYTGIIEKVEADSKLATINELTPGRPYIAYAKTNCGPESESPESAGEFVFYALSDRTVTMDIDEPYINDFEDASKYEDFSFYHAGQDYGVNESMGRVNWFIGSALPSVEGLEGNHSLYTSEDLGVTPMWTDGYTYAFLKVHFSESYQHDISFDYMIPTQQQVDHHLRVYFIDEGDTNFVLKPALHYGNEFDEIFNEENPTSAWQHFETSVFGYEGQTKYMVFQYSTLDFRNPAVRDSGYSVAIDNIKIEAPRCQIPHHLAINSVEPTAVRLTWEDDGSDANRYIIHYATDTATGDNEDIWDSTTYTPSQKWVDIENLDPNMDYKLYIVADCGEDDNGVHTYSKPSDMFYFWTPCEQGVDIPYEFNSQDVSSDSVGQTPMCWARLLRYNTLYYHNTPVLISTQGGLPWLWCAHEKQYGEGYIVFPKINDGWDMDTLTLSVLIDNGSYLDTFYVGVMDNPYDFESFDSVGRIITTYQGWYDVALTLYDGLGRYIALKTTGNQTEDFSMNQVKIDYSPKCSRPFDLESLEATRHTANVKWRRSLEQQQDYIIYYQTYQEDEPAKNPVWDTVHCHYDGAGFDVYQTLTNLDAGRHYRWYVVMDCEDTAIRARNYATFMTECEESIDLPYALVNTNTGNIGYTPDDVYNWILYIECWTVHHSLTTYAYNYCSPLWYQYDGSEFYYKDAITFCNEEHSASSNLDVWASDAILVSPKISEQFPMNKVLLTMDMIVENSSIAIDIGKKSGLRVGVMTDPNDTSTFEEVAYIDESEMAQGMRWQKLDSSGVHIRVPLTEYTGAARYVALRPIDSCAKRIVVSNLIIDTIDLCEPPAFLTADTVKESSAVLSWTPVSGEGLNYIVHYKAIVGSADTAWHTASAQLDDNHRYTLTNLQPNTKYELYVTAVCEKEEVLPSNTIDIYTLGEATDLPYVTDFSASDNVRSTWMIDNSASDTVNSWYMGQPSGVPWTGLYYSLSEEDTMYLPGYRACVAATKVLNMTESDSVIVRFDLSVGGTGWGSTNYMPEMYLKVFLVPYYEQFSSGFVIQDNMQYNYTDGAMNFTKYKDSQKNKEIYYINKKWNAYFHVDDTLVNPIKNGKAKLVFVWVNTEGGGMNAFATVIRNLVVATPGMELNKFIVTTNEPTGIENGNATLSGNVVTVGDIQLTERGFEWKEATASVYNTQEVYEGEFEYTLSGLKPATEYIYRAYARTIDSVSYGQEMTFRTDTFVVQDPIVTTESVTDWDSTSVTLNATIVKGNIMIEERGFEWKQKDAEEYNVQTVEGEDTITFALTGLTPATEYTYRGYAKTSEKTIYGNEVEFTTMANVKHPDVITSAPSARTAESITFEGNVTKGEKEILEKGFEWKLSSVADYTDKQAVEGDKLSYTATGLTPATSYDYRAYARTEDTTIYGQKITVLTQEQGSDIVKPTVITSAVSGVGDVSAILNGRITKGTEAITRQGFEWKQASASSYTAVDAAGEQITYTLTGLNPETEYVYRAFATTASGTEYGAEVRFTTSKSGLADINGGLRITLYPNPTEDNAVLTLNGLISAAKVIVTDVQGRVISAQIFNRGEESMVINTENLASGVYYIRVITEDGIIKTEKLIKK